MAEHLFLIVLIYFFHTPTQAPLSALPPAKLMVNKQLILETDSVTLDCQAPSYPPVFQCDFLIVDSKNTMRKLCTRTVTGRELLRRSQQIPPAVVQVECFYTARYSHLNIQSPHSKIWSITIQGPGVLQTTTRWAASTLETSASVTVGVIGRRSRPSASTSPPPTSDCPFVDGASEVPATLTPWLPTQTHTNTQTQTQGKSSSSSHPASSWSSAGWTLAHIDEFLPFSQKPAGAASDERDEKAKDKDRLMVKMVIALTSFGVIVGVILLGLTIRRTVSERRQRPEHQNIEDDYHMYSTVAYEVAPSLKHNMIYSKVEAH